MRASFIDSDPEDMDFIHCAIPVRITDQECVDLSELAARAGMSTGELLTSFIHDLTGSDHSNGSDERECASGWYERCCFELTREESFVSWLADRYELDFAYRNMCTIAALEDLKNHMGDRIEKWALSRRIEKELSELEEEYYQPYFFAMLRERKPYESKIQAFNHLREYTSQLDEMRGMS